MVEPTVISTLAAVAGSIGVDLGPSDWVSITQDRIDDFAKATGDDQWIHTDVERARRESPWKETIAHGYLTLSLLPMLTAEIGIVPEGVPAALNYGTDKVRFLAPVKSGSRVRARTELVAAVEKKPGQILLLHDTVVAPFRFARRIELSDRVFRRNFSAPAIL